MPLATFLVRTGEGWNCLDGYTSAVKEERVFHNFSLGSSSRHTKSYVVRWLLNRQQRDKAASGEDGLVQRVGGV